MSRSTIPEGWWIKDKRKRRKWVRRSLRPPQSFEPEPELSKEKRLCVIEVMQYEPAIHWPCSLEYESPLQMRRGAVSAAIHWNEAPWWALPEEIL